MILGGDQGAVISVDGLNEHPTWSSWLNQADRADLSRRGRQSFPVLGDRRAAGQRRGARPLARPVRRHHDARLGTAVRRRRERLHRARSAASRDRVRRHRHALQRRDRQDRERVAGSRSADAGAPHLDGAAGVLDGRSARALFQRSVSVQDDRRRRVTGRASART